MFHTTSSPRANMSARIAISWLCLASTCLADLRYRHFQAPAAPAAEEPAELTFVDDGEDTAGRSSAPVPLQIEVDAAASHHRLVIPAALLTERAGDAAVSGEPSSISSTRGIIAALALSAAVALGLIAFRRGRASRLAAVIACGVVAAGAAGLPDCDVARADVPGPLFFERPVRQRPTTVAPRSVTLAQGGKVIVEITAGDEEHVVFVVGNARNRTE